MERLKSVKANKLRILEQQYNKRGITRFTNWIQSNQARCCLGAGPAPTRHAVHVAPGMHQVMRYMFHV